MVALQEVWLSLYTFLAIDGKVSAVLVAARITAKHWQDLKQ